MAGNSIEENQRLLTALREKCIQLRHEKEMLLNELVSPGGKTLRELNDEIQRLENERYANLAGWSPGQQAQLDALLDTPRYANEFWPIYRQWFRAEGEYSRLLKKMKLAGQLPCSEVAPNSSKVDLKGVAVSEDERAGPNTVDFSENIPLLSKGAHSNDYKSNVSCSTVRQRSGISHH